MNFRRWGMGCMGRPRSLRILASYEAKTAKISNFQIFWSITLLIYHLFTTWQREIRKIRKDRILYRLCQFCPDQKLLVVVYNKFDEEGWNFLPSVHVHFGLIFFTEALYNVKNGWLYRTNARIVSLIYYTHKFIWSPQCIMRKWSGLLSLEWRYIISWSMRFWGILKHFQLKNIRCNFASKIG